MMIHVVAVITAKPGKREAILTAFRANMPAVLAEEGCVEYMPTVDADNAGGLLAPFGEDTFVVIEKWQTLAHLQAHAASPHMAAYGKKVKDLIADRAVHVLSPVA